MPSLTDEALLGELDGKPSGYLLQLVVLKTQLEKYTNFYFDAFHLSAVLAGVSVLRPRLDSRFRNGGKPAETGLQHAPQSDPH